MRRRRSRERGVKTSSGNGSSKRNIEFNRTVGCGNK